MGQIGGCDDRGNGEEACKRAQGWSEKEGTHLKDTSGDETAGLRDCRLGGPGTQTSSLEEGGSPRAEGRGAIPCGITGPGDGEEVLHSPLGRSLFTGLPEVRGAGALLRGEEGGEQVPFLGAVPTLSTLLSAWSAPAWEH